MAESSVIWSICGIDRRLPDGSEYPSSSVFAIHWRAFFSKENQSSKAVGVIQLPEPEPENFIPYSNLTEDKVLEWVFSKLGPEKVSNIEFGLRYEVENKLNPSEILNELPWVNKFNSEQN